MQDPGHVAREREFHDRRFGEESEGRSSDRMYAITGRSGSAYRDHVARVARGSVLEIGCGANAEAWSLAQRGVSVTAIDISGVAVEAAREQAAREGSSGVSFEEMNAEELTFDDASFDAVIGSGILHHLDLAKGVPEAARVLRPDGAALFLEPLGHNPLLRLYRRVTPSERSPDEHPLLRADLRYFERWFDRVELHFFHLASLAAIVLMGRASFERVLGVLDRVDETILRRWQFLQNQAWFVLLELREPKVRQFEQQGRDRLPG